MTEPLSDVYPITLTAKSSLGKVHQSLYSTFFNLEKTHTTASLRHLPPRHHAPTWYLVTQKNTTVSVRSAIPKDSNWEPPIRQPSFAVPSCRGACTNAAAPTIREETTMPLSLPCPSASTRSFPLNILHSMAVERPFASELSSSLIPCVRNLLLHSSIGETTMLVFTSFH